MKKRFAFLLFACLILVYVMGFVSSADEDYSYIIANSNDWKDTYSIIHYANLKEISSDFLVGQNDGPLLVKDLNKANIVRVISSRSNNFIINYDGYLRDQDFKGAFETSVADANLDLVDELPEIDNFIVVNSQYGYNGIAVAPYAVLNKSWVFFANRANIAEIDSILSRRDVKQLIIYGYVDREVKDALNKYKPEIIDNRDRFKDNVAIVKKYMSIDPVKQVAFTNGEFIEKEIMSGLEPVLFTGKDSTPDEISKYIKDSSNIEVGVLVGADLVGAATNIRRTTGISVIVKFARGARNPSGAISAVEGIDTFAIPSPIMNLDVYSLRYNKATSVIEVTYNGTSNIPVYLKGLINLEDNTGKKLRIGDVDPVYFAPNSYKTLTYTDVDFSGNEIYGDLYTLYGESSNALEKILQKRVKVEIINVVDNCRINISSVKYSAPKKSILVTVKNTGSIDCWAQAELQDLYVDGAETIVSSDSALKVDSQKSMVLPISQELTDSDLEQNSVVDVRVYYGERKDSLLKSVSAKLSLGIERISFAIISYVVLGILLLVAIIFLIIFIRRRKKDDWD